MTNEHLIRQLADNHDELSRDHHSLLRFGQFLNRQLQTRRSNKAAYARIPCLAVHADNEASPAARAALAGVTACLATMALLVTVALLATAGTRSAAAYPAVTHMIVT